MRGRGASGRGSGLGLSQVFGFMRQSGGHVTIYSELGAGTTVRLYLPRHTGPEAAAEAPAEAAAVEGAANEIVLIVEDDEDVRANTVRMVEELGYAVLEAEEARRPSRCTKGPTGGAPAIRRCRVARRAQRPPARRQGARAAPRPRRTVHLGLCAQRHRASWVDPGVEMIGKPFTFSALGAKLRKVLDA